MATNVQQAYNKWSEQYDTNYNRTRDLEAIALRETLLHLSEAAILEIGCGTGKNSEWFIEKGSQLVGIDLSPEMLAKAKEKVPSENAIFIQADINQEWLFAPDHSFDLVSFSLVLEHIENLDNIFKQAAKKLRPGGMVYVGELHPFKQYAGSKARFETESGLQVVDCFTHHVSDFAQAAKRNALQLVDLTEYFDEDNKNELPRLLVMLFRK
jgi:ubiquinone/menaquinone biosynthesis C-methylase UbiE